MATPKQCFYEYAVAFEQTYVDDDWSRLEPFFDADAVYEVRGDGFGCEIKGRPAILHGLKKAVDGFDRQCTRHVELIGKPEIDGDTVTAPWRATYGRAEAPPLVFDGTSIATVRDGRIVHLVDEYAPSEAAKATAWIRDHAPELDLSYV
jgi:SnoaL-like domain